MYEASPRAAQSVTVSFNPKRKARRKNRARFCAFLRGHVLFRARANNFPSNLPRGIDNRRRVRYHGCGKK